MSRPALTRWLLGHTRSLVPTLALAVVARILGQLAGVALLVTAVSAVVEAWVQAMLSSTSAGARTALSPWPVIGVLAGIALAKAALRYSEHYAGHWVAFTALQRLRDLFFERLVPQAPAATRGRAGAELTQRATRDIDRIEVFFAHTLPPAVSAVVVPAVSLTWLGVAVDGALAITAAPFVVAALLVPWLAGPATWAAARRTARRRGALAAHLGDDVQGLREILAFDLADARLASLDDASAELAAARRASGRVQALRAALGTGLQLGSLVALLAVGSLGSDVAIAATVVVALWKPTQGIDDFVTGLDESFAAAERVRAVIEAPPRVADPASPAPAPSGHDVALDGVSLTYPGAARPALDGVSLTFPSGSWSAVVGVSGGGKSTLAHLLPRGFDPTPEPSAWAASTSHTCPWMSSARESDSWRNARRCSREPSPTTSVSPPRTPPTTTSSPRCASPRWTTGSRACRRASPRGSASAARPSPAASCSGSPWRAPSSRGRPCSSSMRRSASSTARPPAWCGTGWQPSRARRP